MITFFHVCLSDFWYLTNEEAVLYQNCKLIIKGVRDLASVNNVGIFLGGKFCILFALSLHVHQKYQSQGVGGAAVWCTMLAILLARSFFLKFFKRIIDCCFSYPSRPAFVYSLYDATFGLGFTVGPVFGAMLFELRWWQCWWWWFDDGDDNNDYW